MYCLTAAAVVTQMGPIFLAQILCVRASLRRWSGDSPQISAASAREISSASSRAMQMEKTS